MRPRRRPCGRPSRPPPRTAAPSPGRSPRCGPGSARCRFEPPRGPSSSKLQRGLADLEPVAGPELGGRGDALLVQVRAVGRAQVLDVPSAVLSIDPGVKGGYVSVGPLDLAGVGSADLERPVA